MSSTDGYIDDVSYVDLFHVHATPAWLHFVATALGRAAPDPAAGVDWCELGCGPGLGTVLTAAANPRSRFVGIDVNAAHIARATQLATAAGCTNVRFVHADVTRLPPDAFGSFDVISAVGMYAWLSPATQAGVRRFIDRHLAPGGLLHLTYSCHPGMSWFAGMQRLLVESQAGGRGDSGQRAKQALAWLRKLAEAEGSAAVEHPAQLAEIVRASQGDPRYLAHEFMSAHWAPQHVAEVMRDLAALDCHLVGSAAPAENIDDVSLPSAVRALLSDMPPGPARETARAVATRQSMRHDVYQRGVVPLSVDAHRQALLAQTLAALPGAVNVVLEPLRMPHGEVAGWHAVMQPVLDALAAGPQSFAGLAGLPTFAGRVGLLNPVFQLLAHVGKVHPLVAGPIDAQPAQAFNRIASQAALASNEQGWLAAPLIGSGIPADRPRMALVGALLEGSAGGDDAAVRHAAQRLGGGASAPVLARIVSEELPVWRRLGVVPGQ